MPGDGHRCHQSGTNGFHGDAFDFLRNGDLNARNFFAPTRDTLKQNQFGGTIGGPVKKNKLFFFFGYQDTLTRQDPGELGRHVCPHGRDGGGQFQRLPAGSDRVSPARGENLCSPTIRSVPASLFDPASSKLASLLPVRTPAVAGIPASA